MRENRQHGSEGGEGNLPDPYGRGTLPLLIVGTRPAMTVRLLSYRAGLPEGWCELAKIASNGMLISQVPLSPRARRVRGGSAPASH